MGNKIALKKADALKLYIKIIKAVVAKNKSVSEEELLALIEGARPNDAKNGALKYIESWEKARSWCLADWRRLRVWVEAVKAGEIQ